MMVWTEKYEQDDDGGDGWNWLDGVDQAAVDEVLTRAFVQCQPTGASLANRTSQLAKANTAHCMSKVNVVAAVAFALFFQSYSLVKAISS